MSILSSIQIQASLNLSVRLPKSLPFTLSHTNSEFTTTTARQCQQLTTKVKSEMWIRFSNSNRSKTRFSGP